MSDADNMGPELTAADLAADAIAAGVVIPWDRGHPVRPYLEVHAGAYRVHFATHHGTGPHEQAGPSFPLSAAGLRGALTLLRAIERRFPA